MPKRTKPATETTKMPMPSRSIPILQGETLVRFQSKVGAGQNGCWPWLAAKSIGGYGVFNVGGGTRYAHRISYVAHKGEIPKGLDLDHLCRNRACVNPEHLEVVTRSQNLRRGTGTPAQRAAQTHCKRGHELNSENTWIHPKGYRYCRVCDKLRKRGEI